MVMTERRSLIISIDLESFVHIVIKIKHFYVLGVSMLV